MTSHLINDPRIVKPPICDECMGIGAECYECRWCGGTGQHPEYNATGVLDNAADYYPDPWGDIGVLCRTEAVWLAWCAWMLTVYGEPIERRRERLPCGILEQVLMQCAMSATVTVDKAP